MMNGPKEDEARSIVLEQKEEPAYWMTIEEDILQYLKDGTY